MRRYAFIPSDYRLPVVFGWKSSTMGFVPDEPIASSDGIMIRVKVNRDTPTEPPPPGSDHDG